MACMLQLKDQVHQNQAKKLLLVMELLNANVETLAVRLPFEIIFRDPYQLLFLLLLLFYLFIFIGQHVRVAMSVWKVILFDKC